jgi:hypothetical protein
MLDSKHIALNILPLHLSEVGQADLCVVCLTLCLSEEEKEKGEEVEGGRPG